MAEKFWLWTETVHAAAACGAIRQDEEVLDHGLEDTGKRRQPKRNEKSKRQRRERRFERKTKD